MSKWGITRPAQPGWYWYHDKDYGPAPLYLAWTGFTDRPECRELSVDMCVGEDQEIAGLDVKYLDGEWADLSEPTLPGLTPVLGKLLPSGNADEFPLIEANLYGRGVRFEVRESPGGGRLYIILDPAALPRDEKGLYLPVTDHSGHSLTDVRDLLED